MNNYLQKLVQALQQGSNSTDNTNGQAGYGANTGAFGSANMFNQATPTNQPFWMKKPQTNAWANGAPNPQAYSGQPQSMMNNPNLYPYGNNVGGGYNPNS